MVLAVAAYVPSLGGGFLSDDYRFVADNPAVKDLSLRQAVRFFTEPRTQATVGFDIYRPLRTLDFAIDWSIAGDSPTFFRVRNLLYHLLGVLLVMALLRRLLRDERSDLRAPAFLGAALFALQPVHAESVAFVSSRGDLLLLVFFVAALLLHLEGRRRAATVCFVLALFSKEVAVVFPAVAFLADSLLRRRREWNAYAVYASFAAAFAGLWLLIVPGSGAPGVAQRPGWPGGSFVMNLVTVGKGLLYYAKELALPVDLAFDWHVPSRTTAGVLDVAFAASGFGVFLLALLAGRRARFASLWFLATILPVLGLLVPMTNPTAERFLLLPSVGFCFLVAPLLARTRLSFAVLACFLALTAGRSADFTSLDALTDAALRRSRGPIPLARKAMREYEEMNGAPTEENARDVVEAVDEYFRLFAEDIQGPVPQGAAAILLWRQGAARLVLGEPEKALAAAREAIRIDDPAAAHEIASVALERLGDFDTALAEQEIAVANGWDGPGARRRLGELYGRAGLRKEAEGDRDAALDLFRRSWAVFPDPDLNAPARAGIRRLAGD